ncbi:MAG: hypothetical protein ACE5K1_01510 [Acidiferrobacterales bacterium]
MLVVEILRSRGFAGVLAADLRASLQYGCYGLAVALTIAIRPIQRRISAVRPSDDTHQAVKRFAHGTMIAFALSEMPAVMGLMLFVLVGLQADFYVLWLFSLVLMLLQFPRQRNWRDRLRRSPTSR